MAKDILPSSKKFSPTHAFIRLLQDKGKLLTNFTQNIDNLEDHAGISPDRLIQCHGSFATATCIQCKYKVLCEKIYCDLEAGKVARCDRCIQRIRDIKPGIKRKRSSNGSVGPRKKRQSYDDSTDDEDDDIAVAGVMKVGLCYSDSHTLIQAILTLNTARYNILRRRPPPNLPRPSHRPRPRSGRFSPCHRDFPESSAGIGSCGYFAGTCTADIHFSRGELFPPSLPLFPPPLNLIQTTNPILSSSPAPTSISTLISSAIATP